MDTMTSDVVHIIPCSACHKYSFGRSATIAFILVV